MHPIMPASLDSLTKSYMNAYRHFRKRAFTQTPINESFSAQYSLIISRHSHVSSLIRSFRMLAATTMQRFLGLLLCTRFMNIHIGQHPTSCRVANFSLPFDSVPNRFQCPCSLHHCVFLLAANDMEPALDFLF